MTIAATRHPLRHLYNDSRWRHPTRGLQARCLLRDAYVCQKCGGTTPDGKGMHADHIEAHYGSPAKFFCALLGLRTLCPECHGKKSVEDRRNSYMRGNWY
jgi:5-methylcytosine-specific restriction endonuclease McrA